MTSGGYGAVLRVPGGAAFCAAATVARLPMSMVTLGSVLLVTGLGRSFTLAGLVAGAFSVTQAVGSPWFGRLTDRYGQTRVLAPQAVVHGALLLGLVAAARSAAPGAVLVALGVGIGLTMPQVGALSRARWTRLLDGDPRLGTALAMEAVIEEAVWVAGPVLVAASVAAFGPSGGLLVGTGLLAVGCTLFLARRDTEPVAGQHLEDGTGPHPSALRSPGLVALVAVFAAMGAFFGFVEVAVPGLARAGGSPGAAGVVLALWTSGSLLSGIVYGARTWASPVTRRFVGSAVWLGVGGAGVAAVATVTDGGARLVALTAALMVAGTANALVIITGNTLVPDVVPAAATTEAYTWLNVTIFAGAAFGAATGGAVVDGPGAVAALWCAAGAGALTAVVAAASAGRLTTGSPVTG